MSRGKRLNKKDPGLGSKFKNLPGRFLTEEGEFNVVKTGAEANFRDLYKWLLDIN